MTQLLLLAVQARITGLVGCTMGVWQIAGWGGAHIVALAEVLHDLNLRRSATLPPPRRMPHQPPRSLKYEYELYVEHEIEGYKDAIPRNALLKIGDEAVCAIRHRDQFELSELVLWDEVDAIIRKRLRIPSYRVWRQRRVKLLAEYQRPEHWGLRPSDALVRAIRAGSESHVLVAGLQSEGSVLYLAAHGCDVTALDQTEDVVARVMLAAEAAGLTDRVHGCVSALESWSPETPLHAVVCAPAAFHGLSTDAVGRVITALQGATSAGGVHLVDTKRSDIESPTVDQLRRWYSGWDVDDDRSNPDSVFLAKKAVA